MTKKPDAAKAILTGNSPAVNEELLKKAAEFTTQLGHFGIAPTSDYKLAPALGGTIVARPPIQSASVQTTAFGVVPHVTL